jgi:hypothetical protein
MAAMFVNGSGQNEQSLERTFHGCFLPSFTSKCEKLTDDRRQTSSDGKSSHCLWQGELKKVCESSRILHKLRVQIFRNLEIRISQKFGENEINLRASNNFQNS